MRIHRLKGDRPTFIYNNNPCHTSLIRFFAILQFLYAENCFLLHLHLIFLISFGIIKCINNIALTSVSRHDDVRVQKIS